GFSFIEYPKPGAELSPSPLRGGVGGGGRQKVRRQRLNACLSHASSPYRFSALDVISTALPHSPLSSRASCPGSISLLAPAFADGWIPATSAGMTGCAWESGSTQVGPRRRGAVRPCHAASAICRRLPGQRAKGQHLGPDPRGLGIGYDRPPWRQKT